jgi:FkbM family methyltransferase
MPALQRLVRRGRSVFPVGWSPLLRGAARLHPRLRRYPARMQNGDRLHLDLRENMCLGYFYHGEVPHEMATEVLLKRILRPGSSFVDIGANVGYYTRLASRLVGPGGRVVAFEPLLAALALLRLNTAELENTDVHAVALSDFVGEATFAIRKHGDTSSLRTASDGSREIRVEVTTADCMLRDLPAISLIKIDVEGFELEVLRGAEETIRQHRPVVYFECLPEFLESRGHAMESFQSYFEEADYRLAWANQADPERKLVSDTPSIYMIATPRDG